MATEENTEKKEVTAENNTAKPNQTVDGNNHPEKQHSTAETDNSGEKQKFSKEKSDAKSSRGRRHSSAFNRSSRRGKKQPKSEFESRVLSARRVSRVVAGGRRFSLSVAVAVGNGKGQVGIGISKGQDMAMATEKARHQAQKNLTRVRLTDNNSISSESTGKYCASVVQVRPSNGFIAGGAVRTIAELAGIQKINAKILSRSKSHLNNARAALRALQSVKG